MPMSLEFYSAVLSFLGGGLLSLDALRARHRIRSDSGARTLLEIMEARGSKKALTDDDGKPLTTEAAMQLWLAKNSTRWAWVGFLLMTAGFVLQILAKAS